MNTHYPFKLGAKAFHVLCAFFLLAVSLGLSPAAGQGSPAMGTTIYVDMDAAGANDGTSWENAFTQLQPALEAALSGDQIWVAAGIYLPTVEHCGTGERYKSFQLKNGVGVYGGFDPSTGDVGWADRDWVGNATILGGDIGLPDNSSDNSYHVFCHPEGLNLDSSAILDGFLIFEGYANSSFPENRGGGMYNYASSPSLIHITFAFNYADYGGAMVNDHFSSPILSYVTFSSNDGGGMENRSSSPVLTNVNFVGNTSYDAGSAMMNGYASSPILMNVSFQFNDNHLARGTMYNASAGTTISLVNVTFTGNIGSAIVNEHASLSLTNATFSGNTGWGIRSEYSSSVEVNNIILWGDASGEIYNSADSVTTVTYSDIQGGYSGEGNIDLDPLLEPLAHNGGYVQTHALDASSPAIDAGDPDPATCPASDARGWPRPTDGNGDGITRCDMGAYEFLNAPFAMYLPAVMK